MFFWLVLVLSWILNNPPFFSQGSSTEHSIGLPSLYNKFKVIWPWFPPYMLTIVPRSTSFVNQQCWLNHVKSLSHVITGYRITYTPRDINKSPRIPPKNIQIHLSLSYFLRSSFSFSSEIGWALPMWFVSTPSSAWLAVAATSSDAGFLAVYCAVKWGLLELNMQVLYLYKHVWPETANEDMRKITPHHGISWHIMQYHQYMNQSTSN